MKSILLTVMFILLTILVIDDPIREANLMAVRIRYETTKVKHILESVHSYKSERTGAIYDVILDLNKVSYRIRNTVSGAIIKGGDGINNIAVLKRSIKRRLIGLGVVFTIEIRRNY